MFIYGNWIFGDNASQLPLFDTLHVKNGVFIMVNIDLSQKAEKQSVVSVVVIIISLI